MFNSKTKNSFRGKINTTTTENNNDNNGKVSSSENLSPKNSGLSYFNTSSLTRIFKGPTNFVQSFGSVVTSKSIQPTSSSTSLNSLKKEICSNSVIFKSKIEPDAFKGSASSGSDGSGDDGGFCDEKKTKVISIKSNQDFNDLSKNKLNLKCNEKKIESTSIEQNCVFETVKIGKSPNSSLNRKQTKPQKNGGNTIKKLSDESLNYSKTSDCTLKSDKNPANKTPSIINDNMSLSSLNQDKINTTSINNVCLENGNENGDVLGVIKSDSIKCLSKKTDENKLDDFPKNYEFSSFKTLSFGSPIVPNFDFKNSFNSLNNNQVSVSQELQDIKEEILNNNEFSIVEESNKIVKSKNPFHLSMNESDILLSTNNNFLNSFVNGNVDESSSSRQTIEEKIISPDVMSALQIFLSEHGNDYIRQFFQVIICWLYFVKLPRKCVT